MTLRTINMVTFGGGYALPAWVAERQAFFARHGVAANIAYTPDSVHMMTHLIAGKYDIAVSAVDNLIAYQEGQGEAPVAAAPDLVAFMGIDHSFQNLMAAREFASVAGLRGRELAVDALTTGYAFILREMIARAGMTDDDVTYVRTGGGPTRMRALIAGRHAAGLLATPLDLIAQEQGLNRLGSAREILGRYQGRAAYANRAWIRRNTDAVVGFMRAYRDAMNWLHDRRNRDEAAALLLANDSSMTMRLAHQSLDILLDPDHGFFRDLKIDMDGMDTVLALRSKFGVPRKMLTDPMKYVDPDLYREAFPD